MKAIRICEYGGTGTLKLESQTRSVEFTLPVYPVDWTFQASLLKLLRAKGATGTVEEVRKAR